MAWYSIDMPEESVTDGGYHRFCRQFQRAFIGAGAPPEMALFACRNVTAHGRRLYLTPSSTGYVPDLVRSYGAEPCAVPESGAVTLVYGVPGAKTLLSSPDDAALLVDGVPAQNDGRLVSPDLAPARKKRDLPTIYPLPQPRQAVSNG